MSIAPDKNGVWDRISDADLLIYENYLMGERTTIIPVDAANLANVAMHCIREVRATRSATVVTEVEQPVLDVPPVSEDPEITAWEKYAVSEKMDMSLHPMHYLFLDKQTAFARQVWKAAIAFMREPRYEYGLVVTKDLPVVAKVLSRPAFGLRNVIQWTHKGEDLEDGTSLVTLSHSMQALRLLDESTGSKIAQACARIAELEEELAIAKRLPEPERSPAKQTFKPPFPKDSPFGLEQQVVELVSLEEILDLFRKKIPKGSMPSATGETAYKSKPRYMHHTLKDMKDWPEVDPWTGKDQYSIETYKFDSGADCIYMAQTGMAVSIVYPNTMPHTFALLRFNQVDVYVNLNTLDALLRLHHAFDEEKTEPGNWYMWLPGLKLPLERIVFADSFSVQF